MTTSIIVVNYNSGEALDELLDSLRGEMRPDVETIVVDNASRDGWMERIAARGDAKIILNTDNLGFSMAVNQGVRASSGRYILLVNPDVVVTPGAITALEDFLDSHGDTGVCGGKILGADGVLQLACRRGFPTPWVSFCRMSGLSFMFPKSRLLARYNMTYLDENEVSEVDALSGSFMMIRRDVFDEIGGFDEDYFLYAEDIDFCRRARLSGRRNFYVPSSVVTHKKRVSAKSNPVRSAYEFYNTMWTFHRKHYYRTTPAPVNAAIYVAVAVLKFVVPRVAAARARRAAKSETGEAPR